MDSQMLRLRYKDKIVGYEWTLPIVEANKYVSDIHLLFRCELIVNNILVGITSEDMINWQYPNCISFASFDPSIKVGDEWFFEGDEVEWFDGVNWREGVIIFHNYSMGIEDVHGYFHIPSEWVTLTLIKRAV